MNTTKLSPITLALIFFTGTACAADRFEPNDSFSGAFPITPGNYSGLTVEANNRDWYKIDLNPGTVKITMTPTQYDVNMVLYNSARQVIAANFSSGQEVINYPISAPGTYYIEIYQTAQDTGYSLDIQAASSGWTRTLDFGPVTNGSIGVYDIDNDGKDEIFIPASKKYDSNGNEIRPGGLICLAHDGTIKWTRTFPSLAKPDPKNGKTYQTTSVTTAPAFADINNDGVMEIFVGVGGDPSGYGDKGGVYALSSLGSILWYFETMDVSEGGDGFPDGVRGAPVVFDIDGDGVRDVIFNSWDHHTYILDAASGKLKNKINLADTIWSTPKIADINRDGKFEILVSADITQNSDARTTTGGIFHVISADGTQNMPGFNTPIGNPAYTMLRGKWEEQPLWSSPQTEDIDGDGKLEIFYGTGNYFHDARGQYIRVWNSDGTARMKLTTIGRTFAAPLIGDINGDGRKDIVAVTLDGYIHAWDNQGNIIFQTRPSSDPIFSSPIAVDIDNDGKQEIFFLQGAHLRALTSQGATVPGFNNYVIQLGTGTPVVKDIDGDKKLDILAAGTTGSHDQLIVFRWALPDANAVFSKFTTSRYQEHQSLHNLDSFVQRFYNIILNRQAEPAGLNYWSERLSTGYGAGADIARGFIFSQEFTNRAVTDENYVSILYSAFFNRPPDNNGYAYWMNKIRSGASREAVLNGFIYSTEFYNLCAIYSILPTK